MAYFICLPFLSFTLFFSLGAHAIEPDKIYASHRCLVARKLHTAIHFPFIGSADIKEYDKSLAQCISQIKCFLYIRTFNEAALICFGQSIDPTDIRIAWLFAVVVGK